MFQKESKNNLDETQNIVSMSKGLPQSPVNKNKYPAPADYKVIIPDSSRVELFTYEAMKSLSPAHVLLMYGKLKINNEYYINVRPYDKKTNVILKMILYSFCEIIHAGVKNPGKESVKKRIWDNDKRYARLIVEMFKRDKYFQKKKELFGRKKEEFIQEIIDVSESDFSSSYFHHEYLRLGSLFWNIKAVKYRQRRVHNLRVNKEGQKLVKAFIKDKILF